MVFAANLKYVMFLPARIAPKGKRGQNDRPQTNLAQPVTPESATANIASDVGRQIGLARASHNDGDEAGAKNHAQAALDILKNVPLNYENLDWRQLAEGDAQWLIGNMAGAEKAFRQAMVAAPQQPGGYQRLFELLTVIGRKEDAQKHLDLCLKKFPKAGFS